MKLLEHTLLLMAVAEHVSIDPAWFLIVWFLSVDVEMRMCPAHVAKSHFTDIAVSGRFP